MTAQHDFSSHRLVILGGGPGGYEAAFVGAQLGAQVTIVERQGMGGSAVLTDVVPSKTLIATADAMRRVASAQSFGVRVLADDASTTADLGVVNSRLLELARDQSSDIHTGLERAGVRVVIGEGRLLDSSTVEVSRPDGSVEIITADALLIATAPRPASWRAPSPTASGSSIGPRCTT